jgi:hypothetical protein
MDGWWQCGVRVGGITIPSQRRSVHYFERILDGFVPYPLPMRLCRIVFNGVPNMDNGGCKPYIKIYNVPVKGKREEVWSSKEAPKIAEPEDGRVVIQIGVVLHGDILIRFKHRGALKSANMFRCGWNTGFVNQFTLRLYKRELDEGYKDKRIPDDFFVDMFFEPLPEHRDYPKYIGGIPLNACAWLMVGLIMICG